MHYQAEENIVKNDTYNCMKITQNSQNRKGQVYPTVMHINFINIKSNTTNYATFGNFTLLILSKISTTEQLRVEIMYNSHKGAVVAGYISAIRKCIQANVVIYCSLLEVS